MNDVNKTNFEVIPYDPTWPAQFESEAEKIKKVLGGEITTIHHMGSTAIPGLSAKDIVDILVVVNDLSRIQVYKDKMESAGYNSFGDYTKIGEEFFVREERGHWVRNIHILDKSNPEIETILNFRDYLREHLDDAKAYEEIKLSLKQKYPDDYDRYRKGKSIFITDLKKKILAWKEAANYLEVDRR